jgi:hypothetical protein
LALLSVGFVAGVFFVSTPPWRRPTRWNSASAVTRLPGIQEDDPLQQSFRFDDSMALAGGNKLSDFATVSIEARIVKAGQAQSSSGDLFGTLTGVKPGSHKLRLLIDQVQP